MKRIQLEDGYALARIDRLMVECLRGGRVLLDQGRDLLGHFVSWLSAWFTRSISSAWSPVVAAMSATVVETLWLDSRRWPAHTAWRLDNFVRRTFG